MAVTPLPGINSVVTVGGTAVVALPAGLNGGLITNPISLGGEGIGAVESLFVDPTGAAATLNANGTTFELTPGQTWTAIPGQTTVTTVNAVTNGHKFSAVYW